ncbi:MAG: hypothetical protein ABIG39_05035 [Candidatus Micrarchaeota archaeon]
MKLAFQAIALLCLVNFVCSQGVGANYEVIVNQEGDAFVFATFSGPGGVVVPLPSDVNAPYVKGAMYTKENNSLFLSVTGDRMATVSYRTNEIAQWFGNNWRASITLPENLTNTYISIALPKSATVSDVGPGDGVIMSESDSLVIAWASGGALERVWVNYGFSNNGGNGNPIDGGDDVGIGFQFGAFWIFLMGIVGGLFAILALAAIVYYLFRKKSGKRDEPDTSGNETVTATQGMRNLMKALNENDVRIIEKLIGTGGEMRRSDLERKSGIPKSSLALSLDRLEKKGIVKIGREMTTHLVSLTEWFRSL